MLYTDVLRLNKEFRRLYSKGQPLVTPVVVVYYLKNNRKINRIGITTGKKIGNAVQRNRVRRIIKEAYRKIEPQLKTGFDFVLVARVKALTCKTDDIYKAMLNVFDKKGMLNKVES